MQLAAAVPVDVMPGTDDPSNFILPQQPLHRCLLPRSSRYSSLRLVTNPYEATVGGRAFLGCSGQALEDMCKYTAEREGEDQVARGLRLLEGTLSWRHLAPTAPDTLPCYPFCDIDPFILRKCPHVYFCGNQVRGWVTGSTGQCRPPSPRGRPGSPGPYRTRT
jgi:DNA polymerase delta subunit 2